MRNTSRWHSNSTFFLPPFWFGQIGLTDCLSIIQVKSKSSRGTYQIRTGRMDANATVFIHCDWANCLPSNIQNGMSFPCCVVQMLDQRRQYRWGRRCRRRRPIRRFSMKIITPTLSSNNHVRRRTLSAYNIRSTSTTENDKYSESHMHTPPYNCLSVQRTAAGWYDAEGGGWGISRKPPALCR